MTNSRFTRQSTVSAILTGKSTEPGRSGAAFASANIALCKYWGKRNVELNLPETSSLSISLGERGTHTTLTPSDCDRIVLSGEEVDLNSGFHKRLFDFINVFPRKGDGLLVETENGIPTAAGLASSASGFAALIMAMDDLYNWNLQPWELSVLARLGSGSACRSVLDGFVLWDRGTSDDGMDSHAHRLPVEWPELRIGLLVLEHGRKPVSSTDGMNRTVATSTLYKSWPRQVEGDLTTLCAALDAKDFRALGMASECNALAMHATMLAARPPIVYWLPETVDTIRRVHRLRDDGLEVYLTMDAGPNVKLVFLERDESALLEIFPSLEICKPFDASLPSSGVDG